MSEMVSVVFTKEVDGVVIEKKFLVLGGVVRGMINKYEEQGYTFKGIQKEEVNIITLP